MAKVVKITEGAVAKLGSVVELRSMKVGQFLDNQRATQRLIDADKASGGDGEGVEDPEAGFRMLGYMLHVDGEPIGMERLGELYVDDITPLMNTLNTEFARSFEPGEEGNA